jgi:hypothetical protein
MPKGLEDHPLDIGRTARTRNHVERTQAHRFEKFIPIGDRRGDDNHRFRSAAARSIQQIVAIAIGEGAAAKNQAYPIDGEDLFAFAHGGSEERFDAKSFQHVRQSTPAFDLRRNYYNRPRKIHVNLRDKRAWAESDKNLENEELSGPSRAKNRHLSAEET